MTARDKFRRFWGACRAARYDISQGRHPLGHWIDAELHARAFPTAPHRPGRILAMLHAKRREEYWRHERRQRAALSVEQLLAEYDAPCK